MTVSIKLSNSEYGALNTLLGAMAARALNANCEQLGLPSYYDEDAGVFVRQASRPDMLRTAALFALNAVARAWDQALEEPLVDLFAVSDEDRATALAESGPTRDEWIEQRRAEGHPIAVWPADDGADLVLFKSGREQAIVIALAANSLITSTKDEDIRKNAVQELHDVEGSSFPITDRHEQEAADRAVETWRKRQNALSSLARRLGDI